MKIIEISNILSMTTVLTKKSTCFQAKQSMKAFINFIATIVAAGLLLSSQAQAQHYIMISQTPVCAESAGHNALAVVNELREMHQKEHLPQIRTLLVIGGLHGALNGEVSDDQLDLPFFKHISETAELKGLTINHIFAQKNNVEKTVFDNLKKYDVTLLAWCYSEAWYNGVEGKLLDGQKPIKVSFSTID